LRNTNSNHNNRITLLPSACALVAPGLGLALADFRQLMAHGKITVLCELGTGEDAGLYRASFYHEGKRVRLVVDGEGNPVREKNPQPRAVRLAP
jgi:hypothetical protein